MDQVNAIIDIRNSLAELFNEAIKTHGPAAAMTATAYFAAEAVHQAEHLMSDYENARWVSLGRWSDNFHAHLANLNEQCDKQKKLVPPLNGVEGES